MANLNQAQGVNFHDGDFLYERVHLINVDKLIKEVGLDKYGTVSNLLTKTVDEHSYDTKNIVLLSENIINHILQFNKALIRPSNILSSINKVQSFADGKPVDDCDCAMEWAIKNKQSIIEFLRIINLAPIDGTFISSDSGCQFFENKNQNPSSLFSLAKNNFLIYKEELLRKGMKSQLPLEAAISKSAVQQLAAIEPAMKKEFEPNFKNNVDPAAEFGRLFERGVALLPAAVKEREDKGHNIIPIDLLREMLSKEMIIHSRPKTVTQNKGGNIQL